MSATTINVNGREYVLCPGGGFLDLDGNLCGFVGSDVTGDSDTPHIVDQMVQAFAAESEKAGAKGAGAMRAGLTMSPAGAVALGVGAVAAEAIGRAARDWYAAEREADTAEARARETQRRLEETRRRHGR